MILIMKICFVCHANICRSFMAQELLKQKFAQAGFKAEVISCGLYAYSYMRVPQKVTDYLKSQNIVLQPHTPALLDKETIKNCDIILVMEQGQIDEILDRHAEFSNKIFLLAAFSSNKEADIKDPIGLQGNAFTKAADNLKKEIEAIADKISRR